jgi:glycosyltransferase involved in cell wall biosynthesis
MSESLRIVFVLPPPNLGGGTRTIAAYAEQLKRRGHQVIALSVPDHRPTLKHQLKSVLKGKGWQSAQRQEPSHFEGRDIDHRQIERPRPIESDVPDADVVIATWWQTAEWVAALSAAKGAKAYFIQGDEAAIPGLPAERIAATWQLPMHKIVCSRWLMELARERGVDPTTSYVPNGVDIEQFHAPPRGKQRVPTVGMIYAEERFRGCDISLAAFDQAARILPALRLVSFGRWPMPPSARRTEFAYCPPQSTIPEIYSRCDAWLWASRREGFGLPLLEAMACRTPVIATPAGAAPELVLESGGRLVAHEDPAGMARAIEDICTLPDPAWRAISDRAHATAAEHTWARSTDLFENALRRAIEESAVSRRNRRA